MFQARSNPRKHRINTPTRPRFSPRGKHRLVAALAVVTGALLATGAPAQAFIVEDAPDCTNEPMSQPFTPWLDYFNYVQVAGGTFESGDHGWSLSGGASIANGNEPWNVSGDGSRLLKIPSGGRAVSPTICVGIEHPTLRFFADRDGGLMPLSTLAVGVRVRTSLGLTVELPIGVHLSSGNWSPTVPNAVVANLLPLLPGDHTPIEFTFTALGGGTWEIDDAYVDPYHKG